jgi:hypothetical protein
MKRLLAALLIAGLASCGGATSSTDSTVAAIAATTTVATTPTSTTIPALSNPPSGEKTVPCNNKAIGAIYGEKLRLEYCTDTWAMGDTDVDTWNCPKTGCEQTRLYHLADGKWSTTAICHRDKPLTQYALNCYIPNAGPATLAEIPPSDVACQIWITNRALKYVEETGCTPSKADIEAGLKGECTGYFQAVALPFEKCDQGPLITEMQKLLRAEGYSVSVDGYFGPAMAMAVYKYQQKKQLAVMGFINQATYTALTGKEACC